MPIALSHANVETAAGEKIEGGCALGQQHRSCQGSTSTAVPTRIDVVCAATQLRRSSGADTLPGAREVVLDQERRVTGPGFARGLRVVLRGR